MKIKTLLLSLLLLAAATMFPNAELQANPDTFLFSWGDGVRLHPGSIAVDKNSNVYAIDPLFDEVKVFDGNGKLLAKWGEPSPLWRRNTGIAVDGVGNIYVSDNVDKAVKVYNSSGTLLRKWVCMGAGNAQMLSVQGLTVDAAGRVYVHDSGSQIQVFDSSGNFLRSWGIQRTEEGEFDTIRGIAVDGTGRVYVSQCDLHQFQTTVLVFDSAGTFIKEMPPPPVMHYCPRAIAVDSADNVYVQQGEMDEDGYERDEYILVYDNSGKFLRKWGGVGEEPGKFHFGRPGLAVDSTGKVYVSDYDRLQIFDNAGNFLRQWSSFGSGDGKFHAPVGEAFDTAGNLYVTDSENHRIEVFDGAGKFLRKWGGYGTGIGQFVYPNAVALDKNANVYVTDGASRIQVFDKTGAFLRKWGLQISSEGSIPTPLDIAVDGNGNVYVVAFVDGTTSALDTVQVFDSAGNFLKVLGSNGYGDGQYTRPTAVAVDDNGNVYVADWDHSGDVSTVLIHIFDGTGKFLRKLGWTGEGEYDRPSRLAVDGSGRIYVTDSAYGGIAGVHVFDKQGGFLTKWGSFGDDYGRFYDPHGVSLNRSSNRVYVADTGNNRIQVFEGFPPPDPISPTVTAFSIPGTYTNLRVPITAFTAGDNVAVTGYLVTTSSIKPLPSAAGWSSTRPTSYTFVTYGTKTLYAWAKDAAGNVSNYRSATVTLVQDLIAPTVTAFSVPTTYAALTVPITTFTATDNFAVTGYLITQSYTKPLASATGWRSARPTTYTFTSYGTKMLYAWAKDAAGNVSAYRSAKIYVVYDQTAPTVTAFSIPSIYGILKVPITTFTASDNVAVTGYLVTQTSTRPLATATGWSSGRPTSYTFTTYGTKTLYAWAKDARGNVSAYRSASVNVVRDLTAPSVTAFSVPSVYGILKVPITTFTASDNVGVSGYLVTRSSTKPLAAATGWSSTRPTSYTFTSYGIKTLYAWAKDVAGNVSAYRSATVNVVNDITAPRVTAFSIPAVYKGLTVPILTFTATDNVGVSGYLVTQNPTRPLASATGWRSTRPAGYTFTSYGTKTLYAWAKDVAGNVSAYRSAQVSVVP